MKKITHLSALFCLTVLLINSQMEGRGPRGGGNFGGGSINRTPSMSRAVNRGPSNFQPSRAQVNNRIRQTPSNATNFARGNQFNSSQLSNVRQYRAQDYLNTSPAVNGLRNSIAQQYPNRSAWFGNDYMSHRDYTPGYNLGNGNGWKAATWATVASRNNNWGWSSPYYYDYGGYDNGDYVYADQVQQISNQQVQAPVADQTADQWTPLGVFSLAGEIRTDVTPNIFMQLAMDNAGNIDGTVYNSTTDKMYPLEGYVDKDTQLASWMVSSSQNAPVMQTGIYNLTLDQTPVKIVFSDGTAKNFTLVRVNAS